MKWPKEWVDEIHDERMTISSDTNVFTSLYPRILNRLHKIGALKDSPKPREWMICDECDSTTFDCDNPNVHHENRRWVKVREVLEEE